MHVVNPHRSAKTWKQHKVTISEWGNAEARMAGRAGGIELEAFEKPQGILLED